MVIGDERAAGLVDLPVVPDGGGEREHAQRDAGEDALERAAAVALERERVLGLVDDRLDPLADATECSEASRFVFAVGPDELGPERAHAPVVARLAGDVGEQVAEAGAREAQKAALLGAVEQHLRGRQRDDFGVGDPRRAAAPAAARQEIVGQHIKSGKQAVEVGEHEVTSVIDVALTTPTFDSRVMSPRLRIASGNSASTIYAVREHTEVI